MRAIAPATCTGQGTLGLVASYFAYSENEWQQHRRRNGRDVSDVQLSYLVELQLNQCNLMSKSTNALFTALSDTSGREGSEGNTLGKSLRALYLANNDIHTPLLSLLVQ